jgi:hypothetical protein
VEGSCENGNEPSATIKCGEVLELGVQLAASREGLSAMKLVILGTHDIMPV